MMKTKKILLCLLIIFSSFGAAIGQQTGEEEQTASPKPGGPEVLSNVSFYSYGDYIEIQYSLSGNESDAYNVSVELRNEGDAGFVHQPRELTGSIYECQSPAADKLAIRWNITEEEISLLQSDSLDPEKFYFVVKAELLDEGCGGFPTWAYYVGGGVVVGGGIAYLIFRPEDDDEKVVVDDNGEGDFPGPPDPPQSR